MRTRLLKMVTVVFMLLFAFGCGGGGGGGGGDDTTGGTTDGTTTPPVVTVSASNLDITTNNYQLNTNGLDSATLTVVTRDSNNAAIGGVVVSLSASAGVLSASQVTTATTGAAIGRATVTFSPGPEKTNQVVTITASSGNLSKTLPITILGTTLTLTSTKSSLLAGANDKTTLTVSALDGGGNPVPGADITLRSAMGNTLTAGAATGSSITVTTGPAGTATATLTALATPGTDTITASALGAQTSLTVNITNAQFGFTSPADNSTIAVGTSTPLTVTWTDAAGNPIIGRPLTFTTTGGHFDNIIGKTTTFATTDGAGKATVTYTASNTATPADITATSSGSESDTLHLLVASINPAQLSLQASPSVLAPSVGGVSSSSTIKATVRDLNNQLVSGQTVVFSLVTGPGGGEAITPGTAVTGADGVASVTFTSGGAVSAKDGVRIRATLQSNTAIYADTTLTIGSEATSIVLGSTNKISAVTVGGLPIGYALPFSVLVVDINGNPIPNATVNLGIYPLYFYTGLSSGPTAGWTGKFKNEDQNRNGILDPGEDGAKGWIDPFAAVVDPTDTTWYSGSEGQPADITSGIPNGRIDPGGVATIPNTVTTDTDGLAAFEIKYAKSFGNWVTVEITASTQVTGDLSTSKLEVPLGVMQNDSPYPNSPFGF